MTFITKNKIFVGWFPGNEHRAESPYNIVTNGLMS